MDKNINILIYPAGGENALEVKEALSYKVNINVYGATSKRDHSAFIYKNLIYGPNVNDENFLKDFNDLLAKFKINFIVPTHDTVSLKLAELQPDLIATVITSNYETNLICRHKKKIYEIFSDDDFCPKIYGHKFEKYQDLKWPCFIKPDVGEGGKNTHLIENEDDLFFYQKKYARQEFLVMEYLPGKEYTIDCFSDRFGNLRFVGPRIRDRVFGGISVNSKSIKDQRFEKIAEKINSKMKFRGYWFFQLKEDKLNNLKLLEISTRPAGTMALYRQRGINFMLLAIYDFMEYDYEIIDNGYSIELDRYLMPRYKLEIEYDSIYLDFDDTLVFDKKVNRYCLMLLYQAKEKSIPVILLTKHSADIQETLNNFGISNSLFKEIIQIGLDENKDDYIKHKKPIFIDNSFYERSRIHKKLNIPVFDNDNVSALLDWRE